MEMKWMAALGIVFMTVQASAGEPQALTTRKEKMSYAVGVDTGRNLRQLETEVDLDLLMKGIRDGLSSKKLLITEKELWETRNSIQHEMKRKRAAQKMKQSKTPKRSEEKDIKQEEAAPAEGKR